MPPALMLLDIAYIEQRSIPEPNSGCWIWLGAIGHGGYGHLGLRGYPRHSAHRASLIAHGIDVEGKDADHLCRNPLCVNPEHLEAVTHKVNCKRRAAVHISCKYGHPYSGINKKGHRVCHECWRQAAQRKAAMLSRGEP